MKISLSRQAILRGLVGPSTSGHDAMTYASAGPSRDALALRSPQHVILHSEALHLHAHLEKYTSFYFQAEKQRTTAIARELNSGALDRTIIIENVSIGLNWQSVILLLL